MRILVFLVAIALQTTVSDVTAASSADPLDALIRHDLRFAAAQLDAAASSVAPARYTVATGVGGDWTTTDAAAWTSGFFPGSLWRVYEATGCAPWSTRAVDRDAGLATQALDTSTHDVGLKVFTSFGNAYRLTGTTRDRRTMLTAAASLASRYSATVGALRSWNGPTPAHFRVIIDNLMNLELLFWGSKHGGPAAWYDMAVSHALRTMEHHVRADGSTYQGVDFDPVTGAVQAEFTHQGAATGSTWARGQAWAIYGFTMAYRETHDRRFLATARRVADYWIDHLPVDGVPFWDFQAPGIPDAHRDTSAAAIAASGLLELATLESDPARATRVAGSAAATLTSLSSPAYLADGTGIDAILLHGTRDELAADADTGLVFGDYYFVEALLRYRSLTGRITDGATGRPIAGASIVVDTGRTLSRGGGRYLLAGVGQGPRTVTISAPGYQRVIRTVTAPTVGRTYLDVALWAAATPTDPATTRCRGGVPATP